MGQRGGVEEPKSQLDWGWSRRPGESEGGVSWAESNMVVKAGVIYVVWRLKGKKRANRNREIGERWR